MHCKLAHKESAIFCYIFKILHLETVEPNPQITEFKTCWNFNSFLPTICLHACFHANFHLHVCRENTGMFYVQTLSVLIHWGWWSIDIFYAFSGTQQLLVCNLSHISIKNHSFNFVILNWLEDIWKNNYVSLIGLPWVWIRLSVYSTSCVFQLLRMDIDK